MRKSTLIIGLLPLTLAACGDGTNPFDPDPLVVSSSFVTPSTNGTFANDLINPVGGAFVNAGDGYVLQVGTNAGNTGIIARAGLASTTSVAGPILDGTATFTGDYHLFTITNADLVDGAITRTDASQDGTITLTADVDALTVTGSADGLVVQGTFGGTALGGTVSYAGINADLTGLIGTDQAVGVFQGETLDSVLTGGFNTAN